MAEPFTYEEDEFFDITLSELSCMEYSFNEADEIMPAKHRHNSVELNLLERGSMTYLWAGRMVTVPPHRLVMFWGSTPHQIVHAKSNTHHYVLHLPLAWFLGWQLAPSVVDRILRGELVVEPDEQWYKCDRQFFQRRVQDMEGVKSQHVEALTLEVRARLFRFAIGLKGEKQWRHRDVGVMASGELDKVEEMASFVAQHYRDPIGLQEIADHVRLHPKYATQLFHRKCGFTLKQYITFNRIHHAQMLLVTTDAKILTIALDSGFGSASRFYSTFRKHCGLCPSEYRDSVQGSRP